MARPNLRVIHSHGSTEDLLFRANEHLASGDADMALTLYTLVLYQTCPGHIFAFLNRATAYKVLGYPELAVTDAYRAAIASHEMRDLKSAIATARFNNCRRYLRAEGLHIKSKEPWISQVVPGQRDNKMARLIFEIDIPTIGRLREEQKREEFCTNIEHIAIYRMCDALHKCGGGALADALGMISDSCSIRAGFLEKKCVWELGEDIMKDIERQFREDKNQLQDSTPHRVTMKEMMKSKATLVRRELYPWNGKEPSPESLTSSFLEEETIDCIAVFEQRDDDIVPSLELRAAEDIAPDSAILCADFSYRVKSDDTFCLNEDIPSASPPLDNVHPCSVRSLYCHPKTQGLYDRILFLILDNAMETGIHPLDNEKINRLSGALHKPDTDANPEHCKTLPWSFANNVLRPIHYLQSYTESELKPRGGQSHLFLLERYDGWVINTLLAKILHSTRIQSGYELKPPTTSSSSSSSSATTSHASSSSPPPRASSSPHDAHIWVGTINPVLSMIRMADPAKGERHNVHVDDSCETYCWNPSKGNNWIRKGERILRPQDPFLGWIRYKQPPREREEEEEEGEGESMDLSPAEGGEREEVSGDGDVVMGEGGGD